MLKPHQKRNELLVAGVCLTALFAVCAWVVWMPGTLRCDDTMYHVLRLEYVSDALRQGDWLPRIFPYAYNEFGYATSLFYSDFMLYFPALLCLLGVPSLVAYEILTLCVIFATFAAMFFCALRMVGGVYPALIATLLYGGSAYFATDLYERGALGEAMAFVFIPFALYGIVEAVLGNEKNHAPLIFGFSGLVLTHNLSLALMAVFFVLFLLVFCRRIFKAPQRLGHIAYSALCTVLATAFFLWPMVEQLWRESFFSAYHARIFNPGVAALRIRNLFMTTDLTGVNYFTPAVGLTMLGVLLARLLCGLRLPKTEGEKLRDACLLGGCFSLFMSTSFFPWGAFDPALNMIQFPWRFHLFTTLFFSMAAAIMAQQFFEKRQRWSPIVCAGVALICSVQFLCISLPAYQRMVSEDRIVSNTDGFIFWDENYLHGNHNRELWWDREQLMHTVRGVKAPLEGSIAMTYDTRTITFFGNTTDNALECAAIYYLGYSAENAVTGERYAVSPSENGWVQIEIGTLEQGTLWLRYTGTAVQHLAPWVSIVFLAGMGGIWIRRCKRKKA